MMRENLSGTIERIITHHPDSGFAVLRVQVGNRDNLVTLIGYAAAVVAGEYLEASGTWVQHPEYGLQFKAEQLRTTPPHTLEGISKYLSSGLVKGIGPHYARKIVEHFGERTLAVIDESPAFLREVKGIGAGRIQRIRESWQEQKAVRQLIVFLQSYGIGTARAVRIYKTYGDRAIELIRNNPYRLTTDVWGVGFQTADELALRLGMDRNSPLRARATLRYVLQQLSTDGHVGYSETSVVQRAAELTAIPEAIIVAAVEEGRKQDELVREPQNSEPWLYLKPLFLAELGVARALHQLSTGSHTLSVMKMDAALDEVERKMELKLAPSQRAAIQQAATQKALVITGGPGVGKTTIVRGILEIFAAQGRRCALTAPTGRAAKRLSETTGREAKTIHRLLEYEPGLGNFKRGRELPLDVDLLVVDEASMVDVVLMNQLLRAVPAEACLVLVGDVDQLPSVGPGTVLADIIASRTVPVVRLTEIFRQAGQSWIVRAAHSINHGELPESAPAGQGDFYFIEANTPETILDRVLLLVRERIPARFGLDPFRDIQVLSPMNRTELGARQLNVRLQEVLNPPGPSRAEVQRYGWTFRVGDKVLQVQNNYQKEVFNGDIGCITSLDMINQELTVAFDSRTVIYDFSELDELMLAYACTIHKAQGSEYPAVIIPLHNQHYVMLQRNLLYTGITRGKQLVVLIGSRSALVTAVQNHQAAQRCSALVPRLQQMDSIPVSPIIPPK